MADHEGPFFQDVSFQQHNQSSYCQSHRKIPEASEDHIMPSNMAIWVDFRGNMSMKRKIEQEFSYIYLYQCP